MLVLTSVGIPPVNELLETLENFAKQVRTFSDDAFLLILLDCIVRT